MTINTSFKVPNKFVELMDVLVKKKIYKSRGEVIRTAIVDYMEYYIAHSTNKGDEGLITSKSLFSFINQ